MKSYKEAVAVIKNKENHKLGQIPDEYYKKFKYNMLGQCIRFDNFNAFVFIFNKAKFKKLSSVISIANLSSSYNCFDILKHIFKHKKHTILADKKRSHIIISNSLHNDNIDMFNFVLEQGLDIGKLFFTVYYYFLNKRF